MSSISIRVSPRFVNQLKKWREKMAKEYPMFKVGGIEVTESIGMMMERGVIKPKHINMPKNRRKRRKKLTFEIEFPL